MRNAEHTLAEEWLPSRFNLAIFRALGLLVALRLRNRPSPATILYHDREQHPLEAYVMSCVLVAVPGVHLFIAAFPRLRWPWIEGALLAVALPFLVTLAWDLVVFSVALAALVARSVSGVNVEAARLQCPVIHGLMLALSAGSVALGWQTAWLGVVWLALAALNAACALLLRAGRDRVGLFSRTVSHAP